MRQHVFRQLLYIDHEFAVLKCDKTRCENSKNVLSEWILYKHYFKKSLVCTFQRTTTEENHAYNFLKHVFVLSRFLHLQYQLQRKMKHNTYLKYSKKLKRNQKSQTGFSKNRHYPVNIYLLKVNNRNTRTRCEICSKLTIKTPERCTSSWCI